MASHWDSKTPTRSALSAEPHMANIPEVDDVNKPNTNAFPHEYNYCLQHWLAFLPQVWDAEHAEQEFEAKSLSPWNWSALLKACPSIVRLPRSKSLSLINN